MSAAECCPGSASHRIQICGFTVLCILIVLYIISIVCVVCINKYNTLFPDIMHIMAVRPYTEPRQDSSRIAGL